MLGSIIAVGVATAMCAITIHKAVKVKKNTMAAAQVNFDKNIPVSDKERETVKKTLWDNFWISTVSVGIDVLMYGTCLYFGLIAPWAFMVVMCLSAVNLLSWTFVLMYVNSAVNVVYTHCKA